MPFLPPPVVQFSLASDAGFVRLFVDHHLLISGFLSTDNNNATKIMCDHVIQSFFNTSLVLIDLTLHATVPLYLTVSTHLYDNSTDAIQCLPIERALDDELQYHAERARYEIGRGNWLSEDITSHILL
jgi:hypothetical protein